MTDFILDYLLVTIVIVASIRMFYQAHPPAEGAEGGGGQARGAPPIAGDTATLPDVAGEQAPLAETLRRICRKGGYTDVAEFLEGAKRAYEIISTGFASGELGPHAHLLTDPVRDVFFAAIAERKRRGESIAMTFIGFRGADVVDAAIDGGNASVEVRFVAEVVSVTRDRAGKVIAGHPERVVEIAELWTFERDLRSGWPDWHLAGTESDD